MPSTRPATAPPRPRSRPARPPAPTRRRRPRRPASRLPPARRRASRSPGRPRPTTSVWPATTSTVPARRSAPRPRPSYTFTGLTCDTNYTLAVDAYDAAGNHSAQATTAIATSACPDTTPPSTPTGLATSAVGQTSLTLSWTASTRQRRRHRLRCLQERHPGRLAGGYQLHADGALLRHLVHGRR